MHIGGNAAEAITSGREGVQSLIDWFAANASDLPIGLAVAAVIVLIMLGLRWLGTWMISGDLDCHRWRGVIGRVLQKTSIFFMIVAALDMVANYAAVPAKIERLLDILFTIDARSYRTELARAEAELARVRSQAAQSESEAVRARGLSSLQAISKEAFDQRRAAAAVAQANVQAAQAAVDSAKLNLEWTQVRAPIAGRAGRALVTAGNLVSSADANSVLTTLV